MVVLCALAALQTSSAAKNVEAFRKATLARDFAWFERTFAPDYVQILGPTKIDRAVALANLRKGLTKSPVASLAARVAKVVPHGKELLVTAAFAGTMNGAFQGRSATLHATWRDEQRWGKANGRWLLHSTRTYGFARTVDVP